MASSPTLQDRRKALWPSWWDLIPEVVLIGGLTFFLVDETDAATSAFESLRALVLMAVVTIAWIAGRLLLARFVPWSLARIAAFGAAAAAILLVVVVPAYDEETVVEALPAAPARTPAADTDGDAPASEPAPEDAADEPAAPTLVRTGSFRGIDHRAAGTVSLYQRDDGSYVVGLERFDIQPGPDYDVYVVPGDNRENRDGGTRLDDLRGNKGTQYYDVPGDVSIDDGPWTVLIWCHTFAVPVANATPAAV